MESDQLRATLRQMLGIPTASYSLESEARGQFGRDGLVVEKWLWSSEPGSRVPAVLFRPAHPPGPMPAVVMTCGHGESKSQWNCVYVAQVYARLGVACLVLDPVGEEERHSSGGMGTRAHDPEPVHNCADGAGRLIMGKLVFDTMRGIDFLCSRADIDPSRIGVAGNSLGGAKASWMLALETRLKLALVSGWALGDYMTVTGKFCTRVPNQRLRKYGRWADFLRLAAPHCAVLILNGDADVIIDREGEGVAWAGTRDVVEAAVGAFPEGQLACWFEPGGGHRPYHGYKIALEWLHRHLGTPGWSLQAIGDLPTVNSGQWCDRYGIELEKLYGTQLHACGASLPDLDIRPITREELACLEPDEVGRPDYTLEGWLERIQE
ncbi:MAG: hypothetical protein GKR89_35370 [Candidatus Latescibacteria bacterium]|nr:hypothetical protein [Candidatus Latescibacterota bacterium]